MQELSRKGGVLLALWHGATVLPIYYCRGRGYWSLISPSRDGELQDRLVRSRGYKTLRGSSSRAGVKALIGAIHKLKEGVVMAWTPDGPKGPAKVVQPGAILTAQKSGCPIVPVGVACSKAKRLHSWDRHMIPMPFSKACLIFGDPIWVSEDADVEEMSSLLAEAINAADARAEAIVSEALK